MEVDSSLTESLSDVSMELQGTFDDWSNQFLNRAFEFAEMLVEKGAPAFIFYVCKLSFTLLTHAN